MNKDPAVTRFRLAVAPCRTAPPPLDYEVIIAKHLSGRDAAPVLSGDSDFAVHDREDLLWVLILVRARPRVPAIQVAAIEQNNGFARGDCFLSCFRRECGGEH